MGEEKVSLCFALLFFSGREEARVEIGRGEGRKEELLISLEGSSRRDATSFQESSDGPETSRRVLSESLGIDSRSKNCSG